jgi:hypothetical protein
MTLYGNNYHLGMMLKNFLSSKIGRELIYKKKGVMMLIEFFYLYQTYELNNEVVKQCLLLLLKYPQGQSKQSNISDFAMILLIGYETG